VIRALIADDEPLARRALVRMLQAHPDVMVVAECGDGETAMADIE
jgi:DNA-binding NarL/FixJ family response regulator